MPFLCSRVDNKSCHDQILILIIISGCPKDSEMSQKFENFFSRFLISNVISKQLLQKNHIYCAGSKDKRAHINLLRLRWASTSWLTEEIYYGFCTAVAFNLCLISNRCWCLFLIADWLSSSCTIKDWVTMTQKSKNLTVR